MRSVTIIFIFISFLGAAQTDSTKKIKYTPDFRFNDGIYLNYQQARTNKPIPKTRIVASIDYNQPDFYEKLFENENISLFDHVGTQIEVKVKDIWGFCNNGIVFIKHNNEFNRLNLIGSLCHFISNITVINNTYDPYAYNYYNYTYRPVTTSNEMRQYIFNFETGQIFDYDYKSMEVCLMSDPQLYDEYHALSKKKKSNLIFFYMRKYNEKHPLMVYE